MSDSLDHLFAQVRADAQVARLAEPADIRTAARRRTDRHRTVAVASAAVCVAGVTGAVYALGGGFGGSDDIGTVVSQDPAVESPTGLPAVTSGQATPDTTSPSAQPVDVDCRPSQLDARPYYGMEGAMGTAYSTVVVQNVGAAPCRLYGHPTVRATDGAGHVGTVALTRDGTAQPVLLPRGAWAKVTIHHTNGNPYPPNAPECSQPKAYTRVSLVVGGELPFALPGFTLSWECGPGFIGPWEPAPTGPAEAGITTRAPN